MVIQVGSRKEKLQYEAMKMFLISFNYSIKLQPEWVPIERNKFADYLSFIVDYGDLEINLKVFEKLDMLRTVLAILSFQSIFFSINQRTNRVT